MKSLTRLSLNIQLPMTSHWTMLFILLFSGLCSGLQHQFHFVNDSKTWFEAQSYCRDKYNDLATIDNMDNMNKLVDSVGNYSEPVWMGLYENLNNWRWSLTDVGDGVEQEEMFWKIGFPNNNGGNEFCAVMNQGLWDDYNCDDSSFYFVCYKKEGINAADRYIFVTLGKNWPQALLYCREHYTDLAIVRNQAEKLAFQEVIPNHDTVWIGLFRDTWKLWSDGTNSSFRYWLNGPPQSGQSLLEGCAISHMDPTNLGKWDNRSCLEEHAFVCYSFSGWKQVFKIKLSVDSNLDMNDLAVTEAILKQMEGKMKDNGMDVKLGWVKKPDGEIFHKEENMTNAVCKKEP